MSNIKDDEVFTVWKVRIYYSIVFTNTLFTYRSIYCDIVKITIKTQHCVSEEGDFGEQLDVMCGKGFTNVLTTSHSRSLM